MLQIAGSVSEDLQILHVVFRAEEDWAALVDAGWLDVENALCTCSSQTSSLWKAEIGKRKMEDGIRLGYSFATLQQPAMEGLEPLSSYSAHSPAQ